MAIIVTTAQAILIAFCYFFISTEAFTSWGWIKAHATFYGGSDATGTMDFIKPGHDQYVYRHSNGLCVIGLVSGHLAFKNEGGVTGVNFNVGKSDRSGIKVTGKRKRNAQHFEPNTALCKVGTKDATYIVCVKGSLLEVNDRLIKKPELLDTEADREGYIAILMPRPSDWLKAKALLIGLDEYKKLREAIKFI